MSIKIEGGGSKENVIKSGTSNQLLYNDKEVILKENFLNLVYPVGSIYWSSNNTNPASLFGGTWTQIKDKFILAAGDSYTNGATGGAATVTLTVSNMPSHSHSFTPSGTVGSHTHSFTPSGTVSKHSHTGPSHTHSFTPSGTVSSSFSGTTGTTGYMNSNASHRHVITEDSNSTLERYDSNESNEDISASGTGDGYHFWTSATNTDHTHSFTPSGTVSSSFSGTAGNTDEAGTGNTGETAPSFTGTAGTTAGTAPSFTGTAGNTGSNGSGSSFSILPPYVVKYCWERTA